MTKKLIICMVLLLACLTPASAQYPGWRHSGSLTILTTPEGADLPATASVDNFPLLVRLDKDWFDFSQAKANGVDIRFSSGDGTPLAYEVDEWDAARGTACIWVRIPEIKGDSRQELKMFWGKTDARSESRGAAVFNDSNGYLGVWHMNDPVKDETGTTLPKDTGTSSVAGMIGKARRFDQGKGIRCGENITSYPTGSSPHTSEAWFRAEQPNAIVLAWGNEAAQGKVTMRYSSPPHVNMECYFSGADVIGDSTLVPSRWVQVVHTYMNGDSRIYVNGVLDGVSTARGAPLAIKSPARMYIGGWYDDYRFVGDIDEVRLSKVTRTADWVKLQYENQKPLQTVVGPLVQPGSDFAVSQQQITLLEGKSIALTARAGGAQKVYWILKRGGQETVAAVDRFVFTLNAGRVTGDTSLTLQFKAIYPHEIKVLDIPVTIREDIPDPVFTLTGPKSWNGRKTVEVAAHVTNLGTMQAKSAGDLKTEWRVAPFAVIKEVAPGKLLLKRAQNSGTLTVTATIHNGGKPITQTVRIAVREPESDPWVTRLPARDEKPEDGQFYARDDKNEGTLYYNGKLDAAADTVFLKVYADDRLYKSESARTAADGSYAFSVKLKPGLIKYRVEFGTKVSGKETVKQTVNDIVCGDAYLIDGQSNALATDTSEKAPAETNTWIRSYGRPPDNPKEAPGNLWCNPVWKAENGEKAELGWWGMELAKRLLESEKVPIFILNAAVGGTRIDQHQRNPADPADLTTLYGRMLWRVQQAKLTHGIRGILWHQGENDQGADGPTGGYGWETYQQLFVEMSAGWKQDFPNVKHYYIFQIWPNSCGMGGKKGSGDMLREKLRTLPQLYSNMSIMSTLGIRPPGSCHFPLAGWAEFARLIQPLIERDNYGKTPAVSITAPNLRRAYFAGRANDTIALEFDQPVVWADTLAGQFYLDGEKGRVASGSVFGKVLTLRLKEATMAKQITYLKEIAWNQDNLLMGANGLAALTFCAVPIER
ncbi:MAG TPA: DUF2341 domain-containing protein [Chthonomonadaceae bacterium]|nr:DUF2341 domain-containing protein [Chthonomonadaceae bacterium]